MLIAFVYMFSCEKENEVITSETKKLEVSKDEAMKELTLIVAKSLQDADFRTLLKNEAMKQFDGDYDVLFSTLKTKEVSKGNSVLQYLVSNCETKGANEKYILNLASQIEDFQISVPVNCDKWDAQNYIPLVTFIPENFDEKTWKEITCYDANGNQTVLSAEKEPEMPVVVLGSCERMDYIPSSSIVESIIETLNTKEARVSGCGEYIVKMKFPGLRALESWYFGGPEIRLRIFSSGSTSAFYSGLFTPDKVIETREWIINNHLFNWNYNNYGASLLYHWIEEDPGSTITVSPTFTYGVLVFATSYTITTQDREIGYKFVDYTDSSFDFYYLGTSFYWQEKFIN
jgi:hypothetical protein